MSLKGIYVTAVVLTFWKPYTAWPVVDRSFSSVSTNDSLVSSGGPATVHGARQRDDRAAKNGQSLPPSPADLLKPDGFQFYTYNEHGDMITKEMTIQEIQALIAAGGPDHFTMEVHEPQKADDILTGGKKVMDVVEKVQNVLKSALGKPSSTLTGPLSSIPEEANVEWSNILPGILAGESASTSGPTGPPILSETKERVPGVTESGSIASEQPDPSGPQTGATEESDREKIGGIGATHLFDSTESPVTDLFSERPMIPVPVIITEKEETDGTIETKRITTTGVPVFEKLTEIITVEKSGENGESSSLDVPAPSSPAVSPDVLPDDRNRTQPILDRNQLTFPSTVGWPPTETSEASETTIPYVRIESVTKSSLTSMSHLLPSTLEGNSANADPLAPLPTELADSLSSMISQVSEQVSSLLPASSHFQSISGTSVTTTGMPDQGETINRIDVTSTATTVLADSHAPTAPEAAADNDPTADSEDRRGSGTKVAEEEAFTDSGLDLLTRDEPILTSTPKTTTSLPAELTTRALAEVSNQFTTQETKTVNIGEPVTQVETNPPNWTLGAKVSDGPSSENDETTITTITIPTMTVVKKRPVVLETIENMLQTALVANSTSSAVTESVVLDVSFPGTIDRLSAQTVASNLIAGLGWSSDMVARPKIPEANVTGERTTIPTSTRAEEKEPQDVEKPGTVALMIDQVTSGSGSVNVATKAPEIFETIGLAEEKEKEKEKEKGKEKETETESEAVNRNGESTVGTVSPLEKETVEGGATRDEKPRPLQQQTEHREQNETYEDSIENSLIGLTENEGSDTRNNSDPIRHTADSSGLTSLPEAENQGGSSLSVIRKTEEKFVSNATSVPEENTTAEKWSTSTQKTTWASAGSTERPTTITTTVRLSPLPEETSSETEPVTEEAVSTTTGWNLTELEVTDPPKRSDSTTGKLSTLVTPEPVPDGRPNDEEPGYSAESVIGSNGTLATRETSESKTESQPTMEVQGTEKPAIDAGISGSANVSYWTVVSTKKPEEEPTGGIDLDSGMTGNEENWELIPHQVAPSTISVTEPGTTTVTRRTTTVSQTQAPTMTKSGPTASTAASTATSPAMKEVAKDPYEPTVLPLDSTGKTADGLDTSTRNTSTDIVTFAAFCNELAFKYWNAVNEGVDGSRSLVLSPFGITSLLAMIFLGARGETSEQMNELLGLDNVATFNPHLIFQNVTDAVGLARGQRQGVGNAAFVRELFADKGKVRKLMPFYKEQAQQFYEGLVTEVNFATIGDLVRRRTNLLVRKQTGGRIKEFVRSNGTPLRSPLAAVSANVYQTDCNSSSASSRGRDGEIYFAVSATATPPAATLRLRKLIPLPATVWRSGILAGYEPSLDATGFAVGAPERLISTIFLIPGQQGHAAPGDSLDRLEQRLTKPARRDPVWEKLLRVLVLRPGLQLQIPKFSHRSVVNASEPLKRMGLDRLFSKAADLRGINGIGNRLFLSDVLQVSRSNGIETNLFTTCGEESLINGRHHVETYPSTSSRIARGRRLSSTAADPESPPTDREPDGLPIGWRDSVREERPRMKLDQPFLYFVRHNPTGLILHMGRFNPRMPNS